MNKPANIRPTHLCCGLYSPSHSHTTVVLCPCVVWPDCEVTGLGTPNVGVMIAYLTQLLNGTARLANVSDPVTAPVTFPSRGPAGTVLRVITTGLSNPGALAMNGTTLLVSDYFTALTTTYSSTGVQGAVTLSNGRYGSLSLAVDAVGGLLYQGLAGFRNYAVYGLASGALLGFGSLPSLPSVPRGVAIQPGTRNLYWTALSSSSVFVLLANGSAAGTLSNAHFVQPYSLAFSSTGTLYVGDLYGGVAGPGLLIAISPAGQTLFVVDNTFDGFVLDFPSSIAVDSVGNIYVVDQDNGRVVILTSAGSVLGSMYGAGAGNAAGNAFFSRDGFVFPYGVALDPRGYYIYVSDGAAGNVVQLAGLVAAPAVGATLGDPQFYGFLGQSYQVHGLDGQVYSVISDALVQINARFRFLEHRGECVTQDHIQLAKHHHTSALTNQRRLSAPIQCWSHPGSYLGELSVQTAQGVRLVLVPGSAKQGFVRVGLTAGQHNEEVAIDRVEPHSWRDLTVTRESSHHIQMQVGVFRLQLSSSDGFLNLDQVEVTDWDRLTNELRSHGLLGQTWQKPAQGTEGAVKGIEGDVDDYAQQGGELFGVDNAYNRFEPNHGTLEELSMLQP